MFGIDTVQEWALVTLELLALILFAGMCAVGAFGFLCWYFAKTIWYWDLKYFMEQV